jgi:hypothetical protein
LISFSVGIRSKNSGGGELRGGNFFYIGFAEKVFPGGGVWGVGFYPFSGGQLANFRGKSPGIFPPDHSHIRYFLIDKRSKSLTQQGF